MFFHRHIEEARQVKKTLSKSPFVTGGFDTGFALLDHRILWQEAS